MFSGFDISWIDSNRFFFRALDVFRGFIVSFCRIAVLWICGVKSFVDAIDTISRVIGMVVDVVVGMVVDVAAGIVVFGVIGVAIDVVVGMVVLGVVMGTCICG